MTRFSRSRVRHSIAELLRLHICPVWRYCGKNIILLEVATSIANGDRGMAVGVYISAVEFCIMLMKTAYSSVKCFHAAMCIRHFVSTCAVTDLIHFVPSCASCHSGVCLWFQHLLPEGLIGEAEKVLCSLVCFSTDRCIRTQFIEACIENLANNR